MTKKQYREQRAAWSLALTEGRVVSHLEGIYPERRSLTSYPTIAMRDEVLAARPTSYIVTPTA